MNPYPAFVSEFARLRRDGPCLPLGGLDRAANPELKMDALNVLIFSPHPDDECIIGALPLRLRREAGMNVMNVAVTQGSNKARQSERWAELQGACEYISFGLIQTQPNGLERVNPATRERDPAHWSRHVEVIAEILRQYQPSVIFFPHVADWNTTHIGTYWLVVDALPKLGGLFHCSTVETEFWGQMDAPNLMVESSESDVADLVAATSFHVGEVRRNPYHLGLPAWMQDNVRRGGELVGGQGAAVPDFTFATLYRLRRWTEGRFTDVLNGGRLLAASESPNLLFP